MLRYSRLEVQSPDPQVKDVCQEASPLVCQQLVQRRTSFFPYWGIISPIPVPQQVRIQIPTRKIRTPLGFGCIIIFWKNLYLLLRFLVFFGVRKLLPDMLFTSKIYPYRFGCGK
jgi:hypothetical protein